jgi:nickel/cobalt transporter (NicO) family protein
MRCCLLLLCVLVGALVSAHPMGNFSVSHYTRLEPHVGGVKVTYVADLAELPSFELAQKWGIKQDASMDELRQKAGQEAEALASGLRFSRGQLRLISSGFQRGDGAGAMAVFRIEAVYELDAAPGPLNFEDTNFPDREGWKEIVIAGSHVSKASHGSQDRSKGLTAYPPEGTPPQDLRARLEWSSSPVSNAAVIEPVEQPKSANPPQAAPPPKTGKGDRLSQLVSQQDLGGSTLLLALGLAFVFGAAHATAPGHGKTMAAAYLVGERGTPKHAILLGAVTTVTHTVSVFALGIATYFLTGSFAPEKVTKILEFVSGISIVILGLWLLQKRAMAVILAGQGINSHGHAHHYDIEDGSGVNLGGLIALGASGGLVPCPSALVLLLTSIALGKVAIGLLLLVAFSLGLASVLVLIGLAVLYAKHLLPESVTSGAHPLLRWTPVFSAAVVVIVGGLLTAASLGYVRLASGLQQ